MLLCFPHIWQDWLELFLITMFVYTINRWLSHDNRMPLLVYTYGYGVIVLGIYYIPLVNLIPFVPVITPATCALIILIHKHSLQKDIIPYSRTPITTSSNSQWLEYILRTALHSINNSRLVTIIFEYTDEIASFVETPYTLHTPVQLDFVAVLLHPAIYQSDTMLWVTHTGMLMSNKTVWRIPSSHTSSDTDSLSILYTLKTNSIACSINQNTRTATLIMHGIASKHIPIHQAQQIIAKHLNIPFIHKSFSKALYEKYTPPHQQQHLT